MHHCTSTSPFLYYSVLVITQNPNKPHYICAFEGTECEEALFRATVPVGKHKKMTQELLRIKPIQQKVQWSAVSLPPAVAIIDFWEAFVFIRTSNWEWMKSRQVWNPNQNILGWLILSELGGGCFTGCILGMSPLALVERYDDFTLFFFFF